MSTHILTTVEEHIATITLNRPEKLNALNMTMLADLEMALIGLENNRDVRVVLLTGSGERAFCVGADIHEWAEMQPLEMWRCWIRDGHRVFDRLARLPQPVIAVLNGYTLGGGLELAMAADLRLAADTVKLGQPEVKLGIIPGWGGTQRLARLVGSARAKQMIFSGGQIDAQTAVFWGLVNEVTTGSDLMARSLTLAHEIVQNAPVAVQLAKELIDAGSGSGSGPSGVVLEGIAGALTNTTEDIAEGVAAFKERRTATFHNR